ncbi:hypothetical protein ONS95_005030 [Cadophora gregata]|uniref:uncharacterized protein n=1 Tax=Cadophora gregata TaxID=51156 RepID=UPI0026DB097B|nr:uncharacterized protein ONS95_005030 [Cadophora gregata]KAK0104760.1 hypothetical protein ONS95_005030 [Cadophora gregata]
MSIRELDRCSKCSVYAELESGPVHQVSKNLEAQIILRREATECETELLYLRKQTKDFPTPVSPVSF